MLVVERARVVEMITLSWQAVNITDGINFDNIVQTPTCASILGTGYSRTRSCLTKRASPRRKPSKIDPRLLYQEALRSRPPKRRRLNNLLWQPPDRGVRLRGM
jgi:hypothetical protein